MEDEEGSQKPRAAADQAQGTRPSQSASPFSMEVEGVGPQSMNMCVISPEALTKSWLAALKAEKQRNEGSQAARFRVDLRRLKAQDTSSDSGNGVSESILKKRQRSMWQGSQEVKGVISKEKLGTRGGNWLGSRPSGANNEEIRAMRVESALLGGAVGNEEGNEGKQETMKEVRKGKQVPSKDYPLPFVYASKPTRDFKKEVFGRKAEIILKSKRDDQEDFFEDVPDQKKKREVSSSRNSMNETPFRPAANSEKNNNLKMVLGKRENETEKETSDEPFMRPREQGEKEKLNDEKPKEAKGFLLGGLISMGNNQRESTKGKSRSSKGVIIEGKMGE